MSQRKWRASEIPISFNDFLMMGNPNEIIYDTRANRATTVGILWGMTYRTLRMAFNKERYVIAVRIP